MNTKHCFWQNTRGPEDISGVSLHYIRDEQAQIAEYIKSAKAEGDVRRLERLYQMQGSGVRYTHPQVDWWLSPDACDRGETGFRGR